MTCQHTTYLSHKIGPDLIIRIEHLKVACGVKALCFPISVSSSVTSFSLGFFKLMKILKVSLFFLLLCLTFFLNRNLHIWDLTNAGVRLGYCLSSGHLHRWFTELHSRHLEGLDVKFQHPKPIWFWQHFSSLKSTCAIFLITQAASICTWRPLDAFSPCLWLVGDKSAVTLKKVLTPGLAPMNCTVASISCSGSCVRAMRTRGRCDTLQSRLCRLPGGPIVCLSISYAGACSQLFLHGFGRNASTGPLQVHDSSLGNACTFLTGARPDGE